VRTLEGSAKRGSRRQTKLSEDGGRTGRWITTVLLPGRIANAKLAGGEMVVSIREALGTRLRRVVGESESLEQNDRRTNSDHSQGTDEHSTQDEQEQH